MRSQRVTALMLIAACMPALSACIDADFARPSQVQTTRVLAMVVDPPVAGVDVSPTVSAMLVTREGQPLRHDPAAGVTFAWSVCLAAEGVQGLRAMQYDADGMTQGCGGAPSIPLSTEPDGSAVIPSGLLRLLATPESLAPVAEALGLPLSVLLETLERVGLMLTVELRVPVDDGKEILGFKRVVLQDRPHAQVIGTNPPPPRFSIRTLGQSADQARWISGRATSEPFLCAWEIQPLMLETGRAYVLDPVNVPDESEDEPDWREEYEVVDLTGRFDTLREQPYYAWFSTAGRLQEEQTTVPADEEIWRAPSEPGRYPLWLVVRDGHAGVSACRAEVDVIAP